MAVWKFLHILGVILMIGNVITTGLWAHWAAKSEKENLPLFAANSILKADLFLTFVGGGLIIIPGIAMLHKMKLDFLDTPWLVHGTAALALSTLVWLGFLLPDQFRMKEHAKSSNLEAFKKTYIRWSILGWLATAPLVYGVWVMVVK